MKPTRPKIGILALTLELYETLAPGVRENREQWLRRDVIPVLSRSVEVEFQSAVFSGSGIREEVNRLEQADVGAILVIFLTYAPSQLAIAPLQSLRVPLLIWNIQELFGVGESYDQNTLLENHGVHGTQDLANVLVRCGVPFEYVTSHIGDSNACGEVVDFAYAAFAKRQIAQSRFGLLGTAFPGMGDFAVDTTQWVSKFGCDWTTLPIEEYIHHAEKMDEEKVLALIRDYQNSYDIAADVTKADLSQTARAELAMRLLVEENGLAGFTYLFTALGDDERTSTMPFVAASRMMADGYGFGGEGDLISAMATRMFHLLHPPVSFSEIFTIDYRGNALFFSHMGEANTAMAGKDRKIPLVARPTPITRTQNRQLVLVTVFEPGTATLAALVQCRNRWKLITALVQTENFRPLPTLCVPHTKIRVHGDVRKFLTDYAKAGGTHHNAILTGDVRARLRTLAVLTDMDYAELNG
ncbi:MAG: hypothetical protein FWH27_08990 [Planctomycetaceae bacterium]|nr:hypothetical protein [Planctomycetaceae bacterium]